MSRIKNAFDGKKAFIGFVTAGDPSLSKTEEFVLEMERAGASLVELGIPFSDLIAEGPIIQDANIRALSAGCTTDKIFNMVKSLRLKTQIPLVFLAYANSLYKYGYEAFCKKCSETGIDGFIIPDLPFEERDELSGIAAANGVELVSLIAPTSEQRIQMIAKQATGFIYVVSSMGVTDIRNERKTDIESIIKIIHSVTDTPVAVEFGINTKEQVAKYTSIADGAIVGSDIVEIIAKYGEDAGSYIYNYVSELVMKIS